MRRSLVIGDIERTTWNKSYNYNKFTWQIVVMMKMTKLPILPCAEKLELVLSTVTAKWTNFGEWVTECVGLTSHSTHNRSFRKRVFPVNRLHWYWQPKTRKRNTTYTLNTKEKQKTALTNKTVYGLHPGEQRTFSNDTQSAALFLSYRRASCFD